MSIAITRVSGKGQVVIPKELRDDIKLKEGEKLLAYSSTDTIVLKKIGSSLEEFEKLASFGRLFAKSKRITKKQVLEDD